MIGRIAFWSVILTLAGAWPLTLIWALNTLFGLGIAYTFETWAAAAFLITVPMSARQTKGESR